MTTTEAVSDILDLPEAPALPGLVLRRFRGESDFPKMAAALTASEAADGIERVVTVEGMANTYTHLTNCDRYQDVILAEVSGEVVGYGRALWRQEVDGPRIYGHMGFLAPAWRRKGIGRAMLGFLQRRLRDIAATHVTDRPRFLESFASDAAPGAVALLRSAGYAAARHNYNMVRSLTEPMAVPPMPVGLEVRPVRPEHYRAIWEADQEAFRDHWGYAPGTETDYQGWLNDPIGFAPHLWQVAWDTATDQVAGMVQNFVNAAENAEYHRERGYTEGISVRRPWRRRGLARALIMRSLQMFKEMGMTEAALSVDTENPNCALRLYESCGFRAVRRTTIYRKPLG